MWRQVSQAFTSGQYSAPKTILGFLGAVYVALLSFAFAAILVLVSTESVQWLIAPILAFVGLGTIALLIAVLYFARKDPTPLVLGQITGGEFNEHRRITQGDSLHGERILIPGAPEEAPVEVEEEDLPRLTGGEGETEEHGSE